MLPASTQSPLGRKHGRTVRLISLNTVFSTRSSLTVVIAEPPKEGAATLTIEPRTAAVRGSFISKATYHVAYWHKADVMKASPDGRFSAHRGHRKRTASRHHRDPIRAINDGCPLLRAKVGRPSIDLGQRQRSFGAHAL